MKWRRTSERFNGGRTETWSTHSVLNGNAPISHTSASRILRLHMCACSICSQRCLGSVQTRAGGVLHAGEAVQQQKCALPCSNAHRRASGNPPQTPSPLTSCAASPAEETPGRSISSIPRWADRHAHVHGVALSLRTAPTRSPRTTSSPLRPAPRPHRQSWRW